MFLSFLAVIHDLFSRAYQRLLITIKIAAFTAPLSQTPLLLSSLLPSCLPTHSLPPFLATFLLSSQTFFPPYLPASILSLLPSFLVPSSLKSLAAKVITCVVEFSLDSCLHLLRTVF